MTIELVDEKTVPVVNKPVHSREHRLDRIIHTIRIIYIDYVRDKVQGINMQIHLSRAHKL